MKSIKLIKQQILYMMPKTLAHKILYMRIMKKSLDFKNPKDLNEKIQWLILNKHGEKETELTDKYKVREYIKEKGYEEYLIKLIKVYKDVNDIKYEELPSKFVLKTNHDSGDVFICNNKEKFNLNEVKKKLQKKMKKNFAKQFLEYHYAKIKPLIICEQYLEDGTGKNPTDYKFFCFNGEVDSVLVCTDREQQMKRDYYDINWNYLNYAKSEYRSNILKEKPKNFEKMVEIASKLSEGFPFVRVDLYNCNGKIYFGELTFTPASGLNQTITQEALLHLGSLVKLY